MRNRRVNPGVNDHCRSCFGWGFTTVWKGTDYQDELECLDCRGSGVRTENGEPK